MKLLPLPLLDKAVDQLLELVDCRAGVAHENLQCICGASDDQAPMSKIQRGGTDVQSEQLLSRGAHWSFGVLKTGQGQLASRATNFMTALAVAVGQVSHYLKHQEIGTVDHVPGTAIA